MQLYVKKHRAHEVMLGYQQSVQGNSGIIIGASHNYSGRSLWEMAGHLLANMLCMHGIGNASILLVEWSLGQILCLLFTTVIACRHFV